ncbi:Interferon-induced transmembrane protein [Segniliparus rotundus DSM 44985]|uniref:Interferon-induced transmembrane protein n=1 Tax=Segniliparus rotundus (strain ATCC BAA-972 / CDC 1076 / CIP 108378 / DSM 44985 / JCM 13578) TaxID=640132 RepID=D6Z8N4_SEGRD|nr:CD225/dispanin family protein [Segniliparus rotundus]ADG98314.1 Interferon-induced transmembrane protein [Segniliparus rotundus DSM 44985]
MTYPPNQPFPGSDPNQQPGSPYGSPYAPPPAGGSPYAPPPSASPYGPPPGNPYGPLSGGAPFGAGGPPPDNKGWAIAAIFLFWPLCFAAFSASGKVVPLWQQGDFAGAQRASEEAKKWGKISLWVCIGLNSLTLICCCVLLATGAVGGSAGAL